MSDNIIDVQAIDQERDEELLQKEADLIAEQISILIDGKQVEAVVNAMLKIDDLVLGSMESIDMLNLIRLKHKRGMFIHDDKFPTNTNMEPH